LVSNRLKSFFNEAALTKIFLKHSKDNIFVDFCSNKPRPKQKDISINTFLNQPKVLFQKLRYTFNKIGKERDQKPLKIALCY
jgi:hypothetical protein